jgi:serine/threonine protein kinase
LDVVELGSTKSLVSKEDFQLMKVVGRGAYGKVYMVTHTKSGQIYAMKSIKKEIVVQSDSVAGTKGKQKILNNVALAFSGKRYLDEVRPSVYHETPVCFPGQTPPLLDHGLCERWRTLLPSESSVAV